MSRSPKKSKKKIIAVASVGVLAAVGGVALYGSAMSNKAETADPDASIITVEKTDLRQKVTVTGTVESAETSVVKSDLMNVKVKSVKVRVGDRVKKGDIIAELDDTDLKEQLSDAEKSLENAKAINEINLNAAQRSYDDTVADKGTKNARAGKNVDVAQDEYNKAVGDQNTAYDTYNNSVDERVAAEETAAEATPAAEAK